MGAGSLITIIAVFAPSGTQIYGWIVGGLMLVLCLGKLILDARGAGTRTGSNVIEVGDETIFADNRLSADQIWFKGGKGVTVRGTTFDAGTSRTPPVAKDGETSSH